MPIPEISVLIDTYNHERFIEQAILSVLDQGVSPAEMEVIVVDDGSTDQTPAMVRRFEPRVRYLPKANGGQGTAFNTGIPEARGGIIAFLDGDDWWAPGKLRRVAEVMAADPGVGMVGHAFIESFNDGRENVIALGREERFRLDSVPSAEIFRLRRCYFGTSRLTLRAAVARQVLPVPEALTIEADEFLFTMAAALGELVILREPLTHYRVHGGNLYLAAGANGSGLRRKERALATLAPALNSRLRACGVPAEVVRCAVEIVEAEAAQLRLSLEGGSPLETYRTENTIYRIQHADASWQNKIFRRVTTLPALLLPPRRFYAARRCLAEKAWYGRLRNRLLPVPGFTKVNAPGRPQENAKGGLQGSGLQN